MDQKAAIMKVIEHFGNVAPGTKCSAVFFDKERIRREKEFYAKLYSENGVHDLEILRAMVAALLCGWQKCHTVLCTHLRHLGHVWRLVRRQGSELFDEILEAAGLDHNE